MKTIYTTIIICFVSAALFSQEAISSGGDHFANGSAQVTFTLGELSIETYSSDIHLTQGFNQTNAQATSINEIEMLAFELFPNPTTDWFQITTEISGRSAGAVDIFDLSGRLIFSSAFSDLQSERISIEELAAGSYLVNIHFTDNENQYAPILLQKQ